MSDINIIVAMANNRGIGFQGKIPWHSPEDMAHFANMTTGHTVIMGRRTWESIGKPLKNRINVVISSSTSWPSVTTAATNSDLDSLLQILKAEDYIYRRSLLGINFKKLSPNGNLKAATKEALTAGLIVTGGEGGLAWVQLTAKGQEYLQTATKKDSQSVLTFKSLPEALNFLGDRKIFIIGGEKLYGEALQYAKNIYVTHITGSFQVDTFMPYFENMFEVDHSYTKSKPDLVFLKYIQKTVHPEVQYLTLIHDVMSNGVVRPDRTGTGTVSVFGRNLTFDLQKGFPLLTTKKVFWKGIVHELLWFLSGSTDNAKLQEKGVHIWDGNADPKYLQTIGLSGKYPPGYLGPIYGFQWRHFGGEDYNNLDDNKQGVDQISLLVQGLKTSPYSRRHIISAWNPVDIPKMAIPPCHVLCQFYVRPDTIGQPFLDCQLYQRSGDIGLGVPFNIASYSLLTHLVAWCCDMRPGVFNHCLGDTHIYLNHVDALRKQIIRNPKPFPTVSINGNTSKDIFQITADDIYLVGYDPWPAIKMELSV